MNISEALIEKYHHGLCSREEAEAIEKWLEDGDEQQLELPEHIPVEEIKMDVWKDLQPQFNISTPSSKSVFWKYTGMAAAAVIIFMLGGSFLKNISGAFTTPPSGALARVTSVSDQTEALKIEFGRESGASYSQEDKMLDFCGVVKITPKENMKLSFTSFCDGNRETIKEIDVKGGTTYFAMDLKHQNSSELIVMDKNMVGELPPIVQNSLIAQFGI
ncbi:hypothetical protein [Dyadobacter psychrotolerans]|uniref:Uncharacterized protein n=1 Tax=Dyadobacter psychrotolerans TaxID=2541721 RepID=A0A4R5D844_9BACT|nr:hypothetical protein [Dyadobacter psychrotolerans]TDE08070.1 hypothetical protein E0F88_33195 [Dyadobacter psychrotolerans]